MKKKVFFIHTVSGLAESFNLLCQELIPQAQLTHVSDESLIQGLLAAGELTAAVYRRVCEHVVWAEQAGADAIQLTCSSISPCADMARFLVSVPLLKIDEPMVEDAVTRYGRIGIVATNPTTLRPTTEMVKETSRIHNRAVEIESVLCEDAYAAFFSGDLVRHDRIVRDNIRSLVQKVDVLLLAQASMARIVETLDEKEIPVPILSSPRPAIQRLATVLA